MTTAVRNVMSDICESPMVLESFKENPEAVMGEYGVPEDHQELIFKGDKEAVMKAAGMQEVGSDLLIF